MYACVFCLFLSLSLSLSLHIYIYMYARWLPIYTPSKDGGRDGNRLDGNMVAMIETMSHVRMPMSLAHLST